MGSAGRIDDPRVRDLVGEARTLQLVGEQLQRRLGEGLRSGAIADQSAAIGRLFSGVASVRTTAIGFEIAGAGGGAWTDDDGALADCGTDYLMRQVSCIGGGTTEMARNVISERVLGMPRERTLDRDVAFREVPRGAAP
jgi:alkylation response protein AidB-like acyl-CoA dehydrogenase